MVLKICDLRATDRTWDSIEGRTNMLLILHMRIVDKNKMTEWSQTGNDCRSSSSDINGNISSVFLRRAEPHETQHTTSTHHSRFSEATFCLLWKSVGFNFRVERLCSISFLRRSDRTPPPLNLVLLKTNILVWIRWFLHVGPNYWCGNLLARTNKLYDNNLCTDYKSHWGDDFIWFLHVLIKSAQMN